jgi:hypothetical protein
VRLPSIRANQTSGIPVRRDLSGVVVYGTQPFVAPAFHRAVRTLSSKRNRFSIRHWDRVEGVALFIALTRTRRTSTWSCGRTPGFSDESLSLKVDAVSRPGCPCVAMFAPMWKRRYRRLFAVRSCAISPSVDAPRGSDGRCENTST